MLRLKELQVTASHGIQPRGRNSSRYLSIEHRPLTISKPFASALSSGLKCNFCDGRARQRDTLALVSVAGRVVKHGGEASPVFSTGAENPG